MEAKLENILKEIWYSGKNDSQVFDFFECIGNQRWLERIYQLFELKPDESRLLTDEAIKTELKKYFTEDQMMLPEPTFTLVTQIIAVVRKAQDAKTASIKDNEFLNWLKRHGSQTQVDLWLKEQDEKD